MNFHAPPGDARIDDAGDAGKVGSCGAAESATLHSAVSGGEDQNGERRGLMALSSDVVVYDVMRFALTTVRSDYAQLQRRARAAGDDAGTHQIIEKTIALVRSVDAIDPSDRGAQLEMTKHLHALHADNAQHRSALR